MLMRLQTSPLAGRYTGALERLRTLSLLDAASGLTLFLVVVFGFEAWWAKFIGLTAFLVFLLHPVSIKTPQFADNHKYLLPYWLWVITLAHAVKPQGFQESLLVTNARFFAVFIFLGAALQKFFSPTYMSGEMFETLLLLDERFRAFAQLSGIDQAIPDAAGKIMSTLKSPLAIVENNQLIFPSNDHVNYMARLITWYDLYVQFAVGLLFVPGRRVTDLFAHALLLFFIFTTYLPAPVFGFGWTLAIIGFVLAKARFKNLHIAYLAAFVAILLYQAPWREWVLQS